MKRKTTTSLGARLSILMLFFALAGCASGPQAGDDGSENLSLETISGGGRWAAALAPSGDGHTLLIQDNVTQAIYEPVYEPFGLPITRVESVEWVSEDELAVTLVDGSLSLRMAPPDEADSAPVITEANIQIDAASRPEGQSAQTVEWVPYNPFGRSNSMQSLSNEAARTQQVLDRGAAMRRVSGSNTP